MHFSTDWYRTGTEQSLTNYLFTIINHILEIFEYLKRGNPLFVNFFNKIISI